MLTVYVIVYKGELYGVFSTLELARKAKIEFGIEGTCIYPQSIDYLVTSGTYIK